MAKPRIPNSLDQEALNKFLSIQEQINAQIKSQVTNQSILNDLANINSSIATKALAKAKGKQSVEYKSFIIQSVITKKQKEMNDLLKAGTLTYEQYENGLIDILKLTQKQADLENARKNNLTAINKLGLDKFVSGMKEFNELWKNNKMVVVSVASLAIWKKIFDVFKSMDEAAANFRIAMGATRPITEDIESTARSTAIQFAAIGVTAKNVYDSFLAVSGVVGTTQATTKALAENMSILAAQTNITADQSAKFLKTLSMAGKTTLDAQKNMLFFAQHMAEANGVPLDKVMEDVAAASGVGYRFMARSPLALIKAAVEAKKLGTSLKELAGSAEKLIDFTNSVTAEMEASVLLGEAVNLQRARELSYRKDLKGLNEEILKIAQQTHFEDLDPFQQKAVAAALGKSAEELGTILQAAREQQAIEAAINRDPKLRERKRIQDDIAKATESQAKNYADIAKSQFIAQSNQSAMKSISLAWAAIIQNVSEIFLPIIAKVLTGVAWTLKLINGENAKIVGGLLAIVGGAMAVYKAGSLLFGMFKGISLLGGIGGGKGILGGMLSGMANGVKQMGSAAVRKGAVNILILSASLVPLAFALSLLKGVGLNEIGALAAGIVVLGLAAAGLGLAAPVIGVGTVVLIGLGAAMVLFAGAAWIASKAAQNLSAVDWVGIASGISKMPVLKISLLGAAMFSATPGILAFSLALIPLSAAAALVGAGMTSMGNGLAVSVSAIERLSKVDLSQTIGQINTLAIVVSKLSESLTSIPDIKVDKI